MCLDVAVCRRLTGRVDVSVPSNAVDTLADTGGSNGSRMSARGLIDGHHLPTRENAKNIRPDRSSGSHPRHHLSEVRTCSPKPPQRGWNTHLDPAPAKSVPYPIRRCLQLSTSIQHGWDTNNPLPSRSVNPPEQSGLPQPIRTNRLSGETNRSTNGRLPMQDYGQGPELASVPGSTERRNNLTSLVALA